MVGWDKKHWQHNILFHAQLIDGKVIIEANNTEDMTELLIEAGIRAEDIISSRKYRKRKAESVAA